MPKRGKLEIMRDILLIVMNNNCIKPTPLLRKSGLSSNTFGAYYFGLLQKDFIKEGIGKDGGKMIFLSEKGFRFLEKYKTIISFIEEFEL